MICTTTLNASIDKAYHMEREVVGGTVMRVAKVGNSAGGKGLNVARVAQICGSEVVATGLVGGFNGQYLKALLEKDGIRHDFGEISGETRSCINILDSRFSSTEFLEPGPEVTKAEIDAYLGKFSQVIAAARVVTISGSAPKGAPADIYQKLVGLCRDAGKQVILDSSGEYLRFGLKARPTMIKPNQDEIEALLGCRVSGYEDVVSSARELHGRGIAYVVVSLGGSGALLVCDEGSFQATPPKVEVANTVGCGDSMVGAFAVALERGMGAREALAYAVAVASAAAMSPHTGVFNPADRDEILSYVTVKQV